MSRIRLTIVVACLGISCSPLGAKSLVAADDAEITTIRERATAYIRALEEGDREVLASTWTEDGDYVDASGRTYKAQQLITQEFSGEARPSRRDLRATSGQIRLITPDVAIEDGTTTFTPAPGESVAESRYTAVWVKREGVWRLDSLRESLSPTPPHNSRLADLSWLLGEYSGLADDGSSVVVSAIISPDGNYILREFLITLADGAVHSIHQRIGWDPSAGAFKSWVFDGDGSFGEGHWKRHGENWIVTTSGVMPSGHLKSTTNIYTQIDADGFVVAAVGTMVGDESRPSVKLRLKRESTPE